MSGWRDCPIVDEGEPRMSPLAFFTFIGRCMAEIERQSRNESLMRLVDDPSISRAYVMETDMKPLIVAVSINGSVWARRIALTEEKSSTTIQHGG